MSDNELLPAVADIMDKKLAPLQGDINSLKSDVSDIKMRVTKIEVTQENDILPALHNLESCYTSTYDR